MKDTKNFTNISTDLFHAILYWIEFWLININNIRIYIGIADDWHSNKAIIRSIIADKTSSRDAKYNERHD